MVLTSPIKLKIAEKLKKDKGFRGRFFRGQAQDEIAMNIRGLREKRKKTQTVLAKESGMKQSAISRIEQADYSAWSLSTLFRVSDALYARLRVTFEPIENVIEWYKEKEAVIAPALKQDFTKSSLKTAATVIQKRDYLSKTTKSSAPHNVEKALST